jgi:hypothetical protein
MPRLRSFWEWFWHRIDSDSVRPFITLYYAPLIVFSIAAAIFVPLYIHNPAVGDMPILWWVWVQLVSTTATLGGLWLRHGDMPVAEMNTWLLRRDWLGLCLQTAGHAAMCMMLLEFEIAVVRVLLSGVLPITDPIMGLIWLLQAYAAAALASYVAGTALLTLQCLRKIHKGIHLGPPA